MTTTLPTVGVIRGALERLNMKQLEHLSELSNVPFRTIYKIRRGETENPGLVTVAAFLPHIRTAKRGLQA